MRILIGGDIAPTHNNEALFVAGNTSQLLGDELKRTLKSADFIVLNLETPLTDEDTPIVKAGANMRADARTIEGLMKVNPFFYGLANNHIMDQGEQGLRSTTELLDRHGIAHCGTGDNLQKASKPFLAAIDGIRIGIYACAEHEYSIAGENTAGANPYDPLYSFDHVKNLRGECVFLIVLYHGGRERFRYPSPELQRRFRKFSECGADVVIAQHTHCIGCMEKYNSSVLLYGQGVFLFDNTDDDTEKTSLVMQVETDGRQHEYSFIPIVKTGYGTMLAEETDEKRIIQEFQKRSKDILADGFITEQYRKLATEQRRNYMAGVCGGFSRILPIRILNKISGYRFSEKMYKGQNMLPLDNYITCETHRELVQMMCEIERDSLAISEGR